MKNNKKQRFLALILCLLMFMVGCTAPTNAPEVDADANKEVVAEEVAPVVENPELILSTTTSTENSGLLEFLLPEFSKDSGYNVKVIAVGTGQALKMGEDGEADVLLVHAKASEEEFIANGHGLERFDVMYNDYIVLGPKGDTNLLAEANGDVLKGFTILSEEKQPFISRGDDSGTHKMELSLWKQINVEPSGDWYIDAGQGMGAVIQMANELKGYTLSDRATYLSMMNDLDLEIALEGDVNLFNQYGVIAVNPEKNDQINAAGAEAFVQWMLSDKGQELIGEFGKTEYGQSLFIPNAK